MPRDFSKGRVGGKTASTGFARKKPWERRDRPEGGDRPYRRPFAEKREFGEKRDFKSPRYDDEQFSAKGKVAEIVGTEPQGKFDMLRKLWDFFREEGLIVTAARRHRPNADDWRDKAENGNRREPRSFEDRPLKKSSRKPAGDHPTARKTRSLEGVVRKKLGERRER